MTLYLKRNLSKPIAGYKLSKIQLTTPSNNPPLIPNYLTIEKWMYLNGNISKFNSFPCGFVAHSWHSHGNCGSAYWVILFGLNIEHFRECEKCELIQINYVKECNRLPRFVLIIETKGVSIARQLFPFQTTLIGIIGSNNNEKIHGPLEFYNFIFYHCTNIKIINL